MNQNPTPAQIISWVKKEAKNRRDNAGYAGSWDDGGANILLREIEAYQAGMAGTVPPSWETIIAKRAQEQDPEFREYVRLANKFGPLKNQD